MPGSHHLEDGRQGEGDVDVSREALVGDWAEGLSVKHCLEGERIHPMPLEA